MQVIYDESLRMGRLVKDLLDLARMEAGHMEMKLEPVDLTALLKRVHRKFQGLAKEQNIQLDIELPSEPLVIAEARRGPVGTSADQFARQCDPAYAAGSAKLP